MKPTKFDIDEFKKYLEKQEDSDTHQKISDQIEHDKEYKKEFEIQKTLLVGMHSFFEEELKSKMKALDEQDRNKIHPIQLVRYAAVLALIFVTSIIIKTTFYNTNEYSELYQQYYHPYFNVVSPSQRNGEINGVSLNGPMLYDQMRYKEAISVIRSRLENDTTTQIIDYFYLGLSYLALDESEEAILHLKMVTESEHLLTDPATWYLAMGYLNQGEIELTRKTLQVIIDENGGYKIKALKLLEELD